MHVSRCGYKKPGETLSGNIRGNIFYILYLPMYITCPIFQGNLGDVAYGIIGAGLRFIIRNHEENNKLT